MGQRLSSGFATLEQRAGLCYNFLAIPWRGGTTMSTKLEQLTTRLGEISDLKAAAAVLAWDQQTYMPPGGAAARAVQLATLARTAHD